MACASSVRAGVISGGSFPGDNDQKAAREWPGNGEPAERRNWSTTVAGRSHRLSGVDHDAVRRRGRGEYHQWDGDLVEVEPGVVAEDAMIAEPFPVVRGDDHQRVVQKALGVELVEQPPKLVIKRGDAVIVAVAGHHGVP